jgi:hypothetical protein
LDAFERVGGPLIGSDGRGARNCEFETIRLPRGERGANGAFPFTPGRL